MPLFDRLNSGFDNYDGSHDNVALEGRHKYHPRCRYGTRCQICEELSVMT